MRRRCIGILEQFKFDTVEFSVHVPFGGWRQREGDMSLGGWWRNINVIGTFPFHGVASERDMTQCVGIGWMVEHAQWDALGLVDGWACAKRSWGIPPHPPKMAWQKKNVRMRTDAMYKSKVPFFLGNVCWVETCWTPREERWACCLFVLLFPPTWNLEPGPLTLTRRAMRWSVSWVSMNSIVWCGRI